MGKLLNEGKVEFGGFPTMCFEKKLQNMNDVENKIITSREELGTSFRMYTLSLRKKGLKQERRKAVKNKTSSETSWE